MGDARTRAICVTFSPFRILDDQCWMCELLVRAPGKIRWCFDQIQGLVFANHATFPRTSYSQTWTTEAASSSFVAKWELEV